MSARPRTTRAPLFSRPLDGPLAPGFAWDATPLAALLVGLDGAILAANAAAGRLGGVASAALPGTPIASLAPDLGAAWPSLVDAVRREGPRTGAIGGAIGGAPGGAMTGAIGGAAGGAIGAPGAGSPVGRPTLAFALSLAETAAGAAIQVFLIDAGPRGAAPLISCAAAGARSPAATLAPLRVLVVDDEPLVRTTVRRLLERRGATVITAADGIEGEGRLLDDRFGLIVCDVSMPGPSGHEVLAIARARCPAVPFILMSGYTGRLRREGSAVEPDMVLEKPFTARVLDAAIDGVLRRAARY